MYSVPDFNVLMRVTQEVMATTARYVCAYEKIAKKDWWNKAMTCGPIVEQATHFCTSFVELHCQRCVVSK